MRLFYIIQIIVICIGCTTNPKKGVDTIQDLARTAKEQPLFIAHEVNVKNGKLKMYWRGSNEPLQTFGKLKEHTLLQGQKLRFAMNGGMYLKDHSPQGLYIENGKILRPINTKVHDYGNFYLAPNGIFYLTKKQKAVVCKTEDYSNDLTIQYATQSGPMLLIDSLVHPKFTQGSRNLHIRNGVGILPNGNPLFVISTKPVNLYDFADYYRKRGCKNALYLDGFVSRLYLPEVGIQQMDGNFGVMIAEVE